MVAIASVVVHRLSTPLLRPFITAVRRADTLDSIVVEVRDDSGASGWGEAPTSWRVTGESPVSVVAAIEQVLAPAVTGLPVDDPSAVSAVLAGALVGNSSARMAVECAAYDLAAQHAGQPLWRYLGGASGDVSTDMTLSVESDAAALIGAAREHVAAGFGVLKVKIGAAGPDAALLAQLRAAVGDGVVLRVDANQAWSVEQAIATARTCAELGLGLEFIEQPVHRDDVRGLVGVARRSPIPVLADESVWTARQLRELLAVARDAGRDGTRDASHGIGAVNIKLAKAGGLCEALEIARIARENGLGVVVGCMLESHVGIAAAAALAAAVATPGPDGAPRAQDLDGGLWLRQSPVEGGIAYDGERIIVPEAPGLGITGIR